MGLGRPRGAVPFSSQDVPGSRHNWISANGEDDMVGLAMYRFRPIPGGVCWALGREACRRGAVAPKSAGS